MCVVKGNDERSLIMKLVTEGLPHQWSMELHEYTWAGLQKTWNLSPNHGARDKSFQGPKEWFGSKPVITFCTVMFLSGLNFADFT